MEAFLYRHINDQQACHLITVDIKLDESALHPGTRTCSTDDELQATLRASQDL